MKSRTISYADALKEALVEEMERDEKVFLMGQDIKYSMWGVTNGLVDRFGEERIKHLPIAENGFCGAATGAALAGSKPVVEIMYNDFLLLAMDAISNQAAKYRYMCGGDPWQVPVTFRMAGTGTGAGAGLHHSQFLESALLPYPGLKVVTPSNPRDAKGLLKSSIRDQNPVVFYEHKKLYDMEGEVPEDEYNVPLGQAEVTEEGSDVTIISYATGCQKALKATEQLKQEGIKPEVIDLKTLKPLDKNTICQSVEKTNKVVIVEDGCKTMGVGAEVSAILAEEVTEFLDGPIIRIAAYDTFIPGHKDTEDLVIPTVDDVVKNAKRLV